MAESTSNDAASLSTDLSRDAASSGQARDWGDLYREHGDFVWRNLQRMGLKGEEARDALHDVFLIVHRRYRDYDPQRSSERTWLFGIAANITRNERRRKRPLPVEEPEQEAEGLGPSQMSQSSVHSAQGEATQARGHLRRQIEEAVASLEPEWRVVFMMFEVEGLKCAAIASELNLPIGTVYSRLHKGRELLQQRLAEFRPNRREQR